MNGRGDRGNIPLRSPLFYAASAGEEVRGRKGWPAGRLLRFSRFLLPGRSADDGQARRVHTFTCTFLAEGGGGFKGSFWTGTGDGGRENDE
jgi:hypothetical protein